MKDILYPSLDDLLKQNPNRFKLVVAAAKRAKQININQQKMVGFTKKPVTLAFLEIAEGKVKIKESPEEPDSCPNSTQKQ